MEQIEEIYADPAWRRKIISIAKVKHRVTMSTTKSIKMLPVVSVWLLIAKLYLKTTKRVEKRTSYGKNLLRSERYK